MFDCSLPGRPDNLGRMRMRTMLRWLGLAVGAVVGIALVGVAAIYVFIGSELDRTFDIPGTQVDVSRDEATIAEGARLARLRGCYGGCHGETVNGGVFFEVPDGTAVVAPDLGRVAREYSVEELERVIRHGVRPDGTSVIVPMPSAMFYHLSDDDLGAIIAFLKSQQPGDVPLPSKQVGPLGRLMFFYYRNLIGTVLAAEQIDHDAPRLAPAQTDPSSHGRYLATTICTECHGDDLRGGADDFSPSLAIVAAYSLDDFRKLMRTGEPLGGRELDLMARVALSRFAHFSDSEISDLHAYLATLASTAPDPSPDS
jgi:cytochrome c553